MGRVIAGQMRVLLGLAGGGAVEADLVDLLDPREEVEAEQAGDAEPDFRLAVGVDVVAFDFHGGAVPDGAFDHRVDF